jgi:hypothetical protein
MMRLQSVRSLLIGASALALAACGGGSGNGVASTPLPPPSPAPVSIASRVDIFPSPGTQEFTTIGAGNTLRIRYDAATNKYEVMAEGRGWETLVDDPLSSPPPGDPNVSFAFAGAPVNRSYFTIRAHHSYSGAAAKYQYQYSNLAAWAVGSVDGVTAFGIATPASGVPVTGSASYQGIIEGTSTEGPLDGWVGEEWPAYVVGDIALAFNFGSGSLSGSLSPSVYLDRLHALPTLNFTDTVYSTGSRNFSGRFSTSIAGANSFAGLFTGPGAQELIGRFAFPYLSPVDGTAEEATGAFIAKRP